MRLPQYEQQINQPQQEVVQPIPQQFGIETAQAKEQLGSGIQQAALQIGDRLVQMEENNQHSQALEQQIKFNQTIDPLKTNILNRQLNNAQGATEEYTKAYQQNMQDVIANVPDRLKRQFADQLNAQFTQDIDQISGHEHIQMKNYQTGLTDAQIQLNQQKMIQNPTNESFLTYSKMNDELTKTNLLANGHSQDEINVSNQLRNQSDLQKITGSFIESGHIENAIDMLHKNSDTFGGTDNALYQSLDTKYKNILFEKNNYTVASNIVSSNFIKGGLPNKNAESDIYKDVSKYASDNNLNGEQTKTLLSSANSVFSTYQKQMNDRSDKTKYDFLSVINNAEQQMFVNGSNPMKIFNSVQSKINALSPAFINQSAIDELTAKNTAMFKEYRMYQLQQLTARTAQQNADLELYKTQKESATQKMTLDGIFHRDNYSNIQDFILKHPNADYKSAYTMGRTIGLTDPQNPNQYPVSKEITKMLADKYDPKTKTDEYMKATQQFIDYRDGLINKFQSDNHRKPNEVEINALDHEALKTTAVSNKNWFGFGHDDIPAYQNTPTGKVNGVNYTRINGKVYPYSNTGSQTPMQNKQNLNVNSDFQLPVSPQAQFMYNQINNVQKQKEDTIKTKKQKANVKGYNQ